MGAAALACLPDPVLGYVGIAALVLLILWAWRSLKRACAPADGREAVTRLDDRRLPDPDCLVRDAVSHVLRPLAQLRPHCGPGRSVATHATITAGGGLVVRTDCGGALQGRDRPLGVRIGLRQFARPLLVVAHLVTAMSAEPLVPIVVVITRRQAAQQAVDPAAERRGNVERRRSCSADGISAGRYSDPVKRTTTATGTAQIGPSTSAAAAWPRRQWWRPTGIPTRQGATEWRFWGRHRVDRPRQTTG